MSSWPEYLSALQNSILATENAISTSIMGGALNIENIAPILSSTEKLLADWRVYPYVTFVTFVAVLAGFGQDDSKISSPYKAGSTTYNKILAGQYFGSRPLYVFRRLAKLAFLTSSFNSKLLLDWRMDTLKKNEKERAKEVLALVTQCGPTFIKLGQALSLRTDLIPEAYALELRQLQDAVPPFDNDEAFEIIAEQLEMQKSDFQKISSIPVASASIGQVYKAELLDGRTVAIKVQRPRILSEISLDLYLLRLIAPIQVTISNFINKVATQPRDIEVALALVDEWGRGFVNEVNYLDEAKNTEDFLNAMKSRNLYAITAPKVVKELSTSRVLTTEWVEGTRLDLDASEDVPRLCGVAVNAYLTMLLDTGILHCDPHPGNLLRTTDGKLCILDWGMTLKVPKDLQYGLLEFIAHINIEDYESLPQDFINLGFSPPGSIDKLRGSGMTEGLAFAFRQLNKGGGPSKIRDRLGEEFRERYGTDKSDEEIRALARSEMVERMEVQLKSEGVDVNGVTSIMEEMSRRNRELFQLPPYVLYVSRAFSTLEGIGLTIDEDYSILAECYPYLARRLMSDNSPRSRKAFRKIVLGGTRNEVENSMTATSRGKKLNAFSSNKLLEMTNNFQSYTASTSSVEEDSGTREAQLALVKLLFTEENSHVQNILLEGGARVLDSFVREGFTEAKNSSGGKLAKIVLKIPREIGIRFPSQLKFLSSPLVLPYETAKSLDTLLRKNEADDSSIHAIGQIVQTIIPAKSIEEDIYRLSSSQDFRTLMDALPVDELRSEFLNENSVLRTTLTPSSIANLGTKAASALFLRVSQRLTDSNRHIKSDQKQDKNDYSINSEVIAEILSRHGSNLAMSVAKTLNANLVEQATE